MTVQTQRRLAKFFCWSGGSGLLAVTTVWFAFAEPDRLLAQARIVAGTLYQHREPLGALTAAFGLGLASAASAATLVSGLVGLLTTPTTPQPLPSLGSPVIEEVP
jgi:hypothetical protein